MRATWVNGDGGQAIIVVAICMAVLVAALAFAIDWGYALAQRRVMQNISDAAVLGAGKYLATGVIMVNGAPAFAVTQEETWCAAKAYDVPNRSFATGAPMVLDIFYGDSASPTNWSAGAKPAGEVCPTGGAGAIVPASTIYVRVTASTTFRSLASSVVGHTASTAAASARVRLSGTGVPLSGPTWAMVRHYDPDDYQISCPPAACDPTTVEPVMFWSPSPGQVDNVVYGSFKALADYSRYSTRIAGQVPQLITSWDQSSHAPNPLQLDQSGNCRTWGQDVNGNWLWDSEAEANENQDKQCSLPNWFYYSFRGELALDSDWSAALPSGQELPSTLTARSVCASPPDPSPSCTTAALGDWVETVGGDMGTNISDAMKRAIRDRGRWMPFSDSVIPSGPNQGELYGNGLVVLIFLWDCAEEYTASSPTGSQWSLIVPTTGPESGDCSQLDQNTGSPDRVHLFTAAPFTFYEGLVSSQAIQGYWGGAFGTPDGCQNCALNALANTAVLIPDE